MAHGFDQLSPRSRHLRFFSPINKLSDAQLTYLTKLDDVNHVLVTATDIHTDEPRGMGLARYIRLADEPDVAEMAITIIDEYQGRGLGPILLDALMGLARENSVRILRGYVLQSNKPMITLLTRYKARHATEADGSWRFELDLDR